MSCDVVQTPADRAVDDGVLLVGNATDPKTLDPHLLIGQPEANIVRALSEGLVVPDPDDSYAVRPGVAMRWASDAQFMQWTFHLRPDARWSDGSKLDASDFLYSFRRVLDPDLASERADLLHVIRNARAFNRGDIADFSKVGIAAPDPRTLVLTMEAPTPYLLPLLATSGFVPVNRTAVEAGGAMDSRDNPWASAGSYVGNGPFLLSEWQPDRHVLVERNPQYWDADNVRLNAVRFLPIADGREETEAFLQGRLHVTATIAEEMVADVRKAQPDSVMTDELLGANYYIFNTRSPPFDDARVRRALALVIDREALAEQVGGVSGKPIGGMIPPGMPGYVTASVPRPDVALARELMAAAGYPGGEGFPAASLLVNEYEPHENLARAVTAMWREHLGIAVSVRTETWKTYLDTMRARDFQIARSGWVATYYDPLAFLDIAESDNLSNEMDWSNPRYDTLLEQARKTADRESRTALLRQAEQIMLREQPMIPLFNYTQTYLLDPRVKGWGHSVSDNHVYKFMSLAAN